MIKVILEIDSSLSDDCVHSFKSSKVKVRRIMYGKFNNKALFIYFMHINGTFLAGILLYLNKLSKFLEGIKPSTDQAVVNFYSLLLMIFMLLTKNRKHTG